MEIRINPSNFKTEINAKEVLKNFFDLNWGSVVTDVFSISDSLETKAFWLIFKSVRETNLELSKRFGQEEITASLDLVSIAKQTESDLREYLSEEVIIKQEFFSDALKDDNTYIIKAFILFKKYCEILDIQLPQNIRLEYYNAFRQNLSSEYQNNKQYYKEMIDHFNNPIFDQNQHFGSIFKYNTSIKKFFTDEIQKDGVAKETLKDLYIDPFFKIYKNNIKEELLAEKKEKGSSDFHFPENILSLHEYFNQYFFKNLVHDDLKENYDMIFLLGQPGQGKTSCCYKLVYDYFENNNDLPKNNLFFVKIRELVAEDFISNPFQEISKKLPNYIDLDTEEGFIILDGLDEAFMSGGVTTADLRNLYERLKKRKNRGLKIILTSRFSYLEITDAILDNTLLIHLGTLNDEQILDYSKKFEKFYPDNNFNNKIEEIIKEDKYKHIKELLQQAVLIYFIGISNIDIEEKDSKAKIYDKIFDAMALRSWDKSGQLDYLNVRMKDNPEIYKKHLRDYLGNLAFEIHQSTHLFITLSYLNSLETTKTFIRKCFKEELSESSENIKEINKYLLISFYFQESNKNDTNETAIEFFHNSLFEYLTAEYFWKENKRLLLSNDEYGDLKSVNYEEYFELLNRLVGNKKSRGQIQSNLIEIIINETESEKKMIVNQSKKIFKDLVKNDLLLRYNRKDCKLTSIEKTKEIFNLFWHFLHTSNFALNERFKLPENIEEFLTNNHSIFDDLKNMEFFDHDFYDSFNFHDADIINLIFNNCTLNIDFYGSFISNTQFLNSHFWDYSFVDSRFDNVIFNKCDFNTYKNYVKNNKFINCTFDNVHILDEKWFKEFIANNEFDENTMNNHKVEQRVEKTYHDREQINYYIVYEDIE